MAEQKRNIIFILILILAILTASYIIYSTGITKTCDTQECFISRAERCDPTSYTVQDGDQIVTSRITPDCSAIIQVEYINEKGVKELFSKKTCFYGKNQFAETILESDVVMCETEEI